MQERNAPMKSRSGALSLAGLVIGAFIGPFAFVGSVTTLDAIDPNQEIAFVPTVLASAALLPIVLLTLLRVRRWRPMIFGFSVGSLIGGLALAVPLALMETLFGDF